MPPALPRALTSPSTCRRIPHWQTFNSSWFPAQVIPFSRLSNQTQQSFLVQTPKCLCLGSHTQGGGDFTVIFVSLLLLNFWPWIVNCSSVWLSQSTAGNPWLMLRSLDLITSRAQTLSASQNWGRTREKDWVAFAFFSLHSACQRRNFSVQHYEIWHSNVGLSPCCKSNVQRLLIREPSIFQYQSGSKGKDKQHEDDLRLHRLCICLSIWYKLEKPWGSGSSWDPSALSTCYHCTRCWEVQQEAPDGAWADTVKPSGSTGS